MSMISVCTYCFISVCVYNISNMSLYLPCDADFKLNKSTNNGLLLDGLSELSPSSYFNYILRQNSQIVSTLPSTTAIPVKENTQGLKNSWNMPQLESNVGI